MQDVSMEVYNPRNTQAVELYFRGEKMAKVRNLLVNFWDNLSSCWKLPTLLCLIFRKCRARAVQLSIRLMLESGFVKFSY